MHYGPTLSTKACLYGRPASLLARHLDTTWTCRGCATHEDPALARPCRAYEPTTVSSKTTSWHVVDAISRSRRLATATMTASFPTPSSSHNCAPRNKTPGIAYFVAKRSTLVELNGSPHRSLSVGDALPQGSYDATAAGPTKWKLFQAHVSIKSLLSVAGVPHSRAQGRLFGHVSSFYRGFYKLHTS
jgi:hypothetical protein